MHPRPDLPFWGARPAEDAPGRWDVALWSPEVRDLSVVQDGRETAMVRDEGGTHRARIAGAAGSAYAFRLDGRDHPDPASRRQAGGIGGPSVLTAPRTARPWRPPDWTSAVLLEVHIGTFTDEGTFAAASRRLPALGALGITVLQVMPIAQFTGDRGWGYDTALPFAPHPSYGTPEDFADLVAAAHLAGLAVTLDVVYNHFGPHADAMAALCPAFFDPAIRTPWGPGFDFSRPAVREFAISNAEMWVGEFGLDGLRLDAVQEMHDASAPDIVTELCTRVRALRPDRPTYLMAEDVRNDPTQREDAALDATWNDDYHNPLHVLLTGETQAYYAAYADHPLEDLAGTLAEGHFPRPEGPRSAAHLAPTAFVNANQTHDQIGNRLFGERLIVLAGAEAARTVHALLLTSPAIPMLFMGEEEGCAAPFPFFADYEGTLAQGLTAGRAEAFGLTPREGAAAPDPLARETMVLARPYAHPGPDAPTWRTTTRALLDWRRAHVLPLLRSGRTGVEVTATAPKSLRAVWRFAEGEIETRVHLGAPPSPPDRWPDGFAHPTLTLGAEGGAFAFCTQVRRERNA